MEDLCDFGISRPRLHLIDVSLFKNQLKNADSGAFRLQEKEKNPKIRTSGDYFPPLQSSLIVQCGGPCCHGDLMPNSSTFFFSTTRPLFDEIWTNHTPVHSLYSVSKGTAAQAHVVPFFTYSTYSEHFEKRYFTTEFEPWFRSLLVWV